MLTKLYTNVILAQENTCPGQDATDAQLGDYFSCPAFGLPLFVLKVLSVAFLLYALFRAVADAGQNKWSKVFGWIVAGAVGVFIGFQPEIMANLVDTLGDIFSDFIGMFTSSGDSN